MQPFFFFFLALFTVIRVITFLDKIHRKWLLFFVFYDIFISFYILNMELFLYNLLAFMSNVIYSFCCQSKTKTLWTSVCFVVSAMRNTSWCVPLPTMEKTCSNQSSPRKWARTKASSTTSNGMNCKSCPCPFVYFLSFFHGSTL